jgi:hypothetical protein
LILVMALKLSWGRKRGNSVLHPSILVSPLYLFSISMQLPNVLTYGIELLGDGLLSSQFHQNHANGIDSLIHC